jgi:hypothetical protein
MTLVPSSSPSFVLRPGEIRRGELQLARQALEPVRPPSWVPTAAWRGASWWIACTGDCRGPLTYGAAHEKIVIIGLPPNVICYFDNLCGWQMCPSVNWIERWCYLWDSCDAIRSQGDENAPLPLVSLKVLPETTYSCITKGYCVGGNQARGWTPTQQPPDGFPLLRRGDGRRPPSETRGETSAQLLPSLTRLQLPLMYLTLTTSITTI